MARIDFHSHVSDKLQYCCRLSRKIMASADPQAQPRTIVIAGNSKELKELDVLMWTFSKTDFLPHAWLDDESAHETPILFVTNTDDLTDRANLHQLLQRFPRWIEVVTTQDDELKAGRERFKAYRSMGHELHHFDQSKNT
jgi:DNA polymerase-3 subunit chi